MPHEPVEFVVESHRMSEALNEHSGQNRAAISFDDSEAPPAVFFIVAYVPDLSSVASLPMASAVHTTGRILALIGVVWCGVLLLKTLSVAHGFGMWRSAGAVLLAWIVMYMSAPLAAILASLFLLG
jgi:hypothetical protein